MTKQVKHLSVVVGVIAMCAALGVAVADTAPGSVTGSTSTPTATTTPASSLTPEPTPSPAPGVTLEELNANRAKWLASGISNYRYDLAIGCFCLFEHGNTVTIVVLGGETDSLTWSDGSALGANDIWSSTVSGYDTMDEAFDRIEAEIGVAYLIEATFDPVLGHPTDIYIDNAKNVADDEIGFLITNFTVIDPTAFPPTGGRP